MDDCYLHNAHPALSPVAPPVSLTQVYDLFNYYCYTHTYKYQYGLLRPFSAAPMCVFMADHGD